MSIAAIKHIIRTASSKHWILKLPATCLAMAEMRCWRYARHDLSLAAAVRMCLSLESLLFAIKPTVLGEYCLALSSIDSALMNSF